MLLCSIHDIQPGMVLGAAVTDPRSPDHCLLKPGVKLEMGLIASLRMRGVTQAWVIDDLTEDLDHAVGRELTGARLEIYHALRQDLAGMTQRTVSTASMQSYRRAMLELVTQLISSAKYAGLTDVLFESSGLATHATNVAYLSVMCALHAEPYMIAQQPRLDGAHARDMSVFGLAGMLHDIGKARMPASQGELHEIYIAPDNEEAPAYREHAALGRSMLEHAGTPARVTNAVLNHHQRFDGTGWPDLTAMSYGRIEGVLAGRRIHVCARVVAAANVLDNLLRDAQGARRPVVAALHTFASSQYDGWFDPIVRRSMLMRVLPFSVGTLVRLSDQRMAVVVAPSAGELAQPCRPLVRVLYDSDNRRVARLSSEEAPQPPTIDLSQTPGVFIAYAMGRDVGNCLYEVAPLDYRDAA